MDDEFFNDSTNQPPQQQHAQNNQDDQFDFGQPQQANVYTLNETPQQSNSQNYISYTPAEEDQNIKRMREEEDRLQEQLRQKSNQQYELKQQRREQARQQLEHYMEQKDKEKDERKRANVQRETSLLEKRRNNDTEQNWKKVASNIALKQGEYVGKKDVNRMREAIINKKNDQNI